MRHIAAVLAGLVALCLATQGVAYASATPAVYLGYSNSSCYGCTLNMVEFTVTNGRVVGVLYNDTVEGAPPSARLSSTDEQFTGTERAGSLTLYFGGFGATPDFATVNGRTISIQVPQANGTVQSERLGRSTLSHYNQLVTNWQDVISRADAQAVTQQQAAAAAAARKRQLVDNLSNAVTNVDNDLSTMQSPGNLSGDLSQVDADLSQVKADLGQVHADNSQLSTDAKAGNGQGVLCSDVGVEYSDAGVTVSDAHILVQDVAQVAGDVQQAQSAIAGAAGVWSAYWAAQHALPTYHPSAPVPPLKVAVGEGQGTIRQAVAHVNADIRQANSYIAQAFALPNAAEAAMQCGPTQKAPRLALVSWKP